MEAMREISVLRLQAPVASGEVIVPDFLGTGANLVACRDIKAQEGRI